MPYFIGMPFGTLSSPLQHLHAKSLEGVVEADLALTRWIAVSFAASKQQNVMDKRANDELGQPSAPVLACV